MNILVIGNGFDLAHGLPTTYKDFIDFCIGEKWKKDIENLKDNDKIREDQYNRFIEVFENKDNSNNIWIKTFKTIINKELVKDKWSDFEKIISYVIQYVDFPRHDKKINQSNIEIKDIVDYLLDKLYKELDYEDKISNPEEYSDVSKEFTYSELKNNYFFSSLYNKFIDDLNSLIELLEIYLLVVSIKTEYHNLGEIISDSKSVRKLKPEEFKEYYKSKNVIAVNRLEPINMIFSHLNKIISFNYTNTYRKIYKKDLLQNDIDFIHGIIRDDIKKGNNNMVLGIDEYLEGEEVNENLEFIRFKKYFQRIYKKTGCKYKNWIRTDGEKNIYIYGHSLDISDKDILKEIIEAPKAKTTIYYHNKKAYDQQIINLVRILGKDNLIERVNNNTLIFSPINNS